MSDILVWGKRRRVFRGLGTLALACAVACALAPSGSAVAQSRPAGHLHLRGPHLRGPHLTPPRPRPHSVRPQVISGPLINNGGPVQTAPRVYVDFWGWTSDPNGEQAYLTRFLSSVGGTSWLNTVYQYGGGFGTGLLAGTWSDPSAVPASPSDAQIQAEAVSAANHFGTGNSVNVEIVVATPTGHSTPGFGTQFCAYHGVVSADADITYTDLPYMTDAGSACGEDSVNGSNGTLDGVSIVEGHELAESITDPLLNAWFDAGGNEIGDKCAWFDLANISTAAGTFAVQPLWSNAANGCALSSGPRWSPWLSEIGSPPPGIASGSGPAVSSWAASRLDVFVRGADNAIWHDWWTGTGWGTWQSLGPAIVSDPAAVSWGFNRIDLFGIGTDGNVYHKWWGGSSWSGWANEIGHPSPGIASGSGPAVSSWAANRLDVFVRGTDSAIYHAWWDGAWNFWESQGPAIVSNPAAVSWTASRIDLFGIGTDGQVWHKYWG